jgi:hypothetical protein
MKAVSGTAFPFSRLASGSIALDSAVVATAQVLAPSGLGGIEPVPPARRDRGSLSAVSGPVLAYMHAAPSVCHSRGLSVVLRRRLAQRRIVETSGKAA